MKIGCEQTLSSSLFYSALSPSLYLLLALALYLSLSFGAPPSRISFSGVTVLIALGIILLILAVLGHCGACNGSKGALTAVWRNSLGLQLYFTGMVAYIFN
uniref:Uncharacterized protein n=1 Tax=Anguilla anguilla TaxID=7936 RepID=A0A0E9W9R6_ANGAN